MAGLRQLAGMIWALKRLALIVLSIGIADSLNPTTVGPALYLATTRHARRQVAEFAVGIFAVNLIGGALIALGPGQLLLALVPHPSSFAKHLTEVVVGAAILIAAAILWSRRSQLAARALPATGGRTGAGAVLGAGIALVELPTAFPYFAAIAAIVASGESAGEQIALSDPLQPGVHHPALGDPDSSSWRSAPEPSGCSGRRANGFGANGPSWCRCWGPSSASRSSWSARSGWRAIEATTAALPDTIAQA